MTVTWPNIIFFKFKIADIRHIDKKLSQRDHATLLVIKHFAKSLKVIQNVTVE